VETINERAHAIVTSNCMGGRDKPWIEKSERICKEVFETDGEQDEE